MEKNKINTLFKNLEGDFDIEMPNTGHEQRFLEKLKQQDSITVNTPKTINYWKPFMAVAASIVLCFSVFTILQNPEPELMDLASISPEMEQTQSFFTTAIAEELSALEAERTPETEEMVNDAIKELKILEGEYDSLKVDLSESGNDKRVIYAMIANFQNRINVLKTVLEHIEEVKNFKTTKMKTQLLYNILFAFVLIPALTFAEANGNWNGKHTKEKTIKKEYSVNADATFNVDNSYGDINITTYEGSTISIEVLIKTNGNDLEKVVEKLNDITIEFEGSSSYVSAKTKFSKNKSKSWWNWGKKNGVNMEITYQIKMPITNSVDIDNDYGNIDLGKLKGRATIDCDYGKITTKELMSSDNSISFDYTNNCYFEYINGGSIDADYSGYTIAAAKNLSINADYTNSEIEVAEDVNYNCDYGSLKIGKINNLIGNGDYLSVRLGTVYKNINLKADYGSIKIEHMAASAENIEIQSDYNGISIGYDPAYSFDFDIDLKYASLRDADGFEFSKKTHRIF